MKCTIEARGNGFPEVGMYVPGDDGNLYRIESMETRICLGSSAGSSNYVHADVQLADWDDGDPFPAMAIL